MCHHLTFFFFFFNDTATTEIYTLSLHDALPIYHGDFLPLLQSADDRRFVCRQDARMYFNDSCGSCKMVARLFVITGDETRMNAKRVKPADSIHRVPPKRVAEGEKTNKRSVFANAD